jgi:hypothetical protein
MPSHSVLLPARHKISHDSEELLALSLRSFDGRQTHDHNRKSKHSTNTMRTLGAHRFWFFAQSANILCFLVLLLFSDELQKAEALGWIASC